MITHERRDLVCDIKEFGDISTNCGTNDPVRRSCVGSTGSGSLFLPLVYNGAAPAPTPSPTPTPEPTSTPKPTPTPLPGELWTWVARAGDVGDTTEIYAVIPGYCCELIGQKSGKIIYVQAVCPAEPTCEIFQPPAVIPPPFVWGMWRS